MAENKYMAVSYKLYTIEENGERELAEETQEGRPFVMITGFDLTLKDFEANISACEQGSDFDFVLTAEQAYGEHMAERVIDLDKQMFCIDGKFDAQNIFEGAIVPLQNEDGNRFYGTVMAITSDKVTMDLNHPLAGKQLNFVGKVLEKRDATNEEIQNLFNHLNGGGCGGCGGGCGEGGCGGNCGGGDGNCGGGCGGCK